MLSKKECFRFNITLKIKIVHWSTQSKRAILMTAIYFKVSTAVRSQRQKLNKALWKNCSYCIAYYTNMVMYVSLFDGCWYSKPCPAT